MPYNVYISGIPECCGYPATPEVWSVHSWPSTAPAIPVPPSSAAPLLPDQSTEAEQLGHLLSGNARDGTAAPIMRSVRSALAEAVILMKYQQKADSKHGRYHRNSMPLSHRLLDPQNALPYHGGPNSAGNSHDRPPEEGDQIRVLFNVVLEKPHSLNYSANAPRMTEWPKGATQTEFHSTCWTQFTKNIEWTRMNNQEQYEHVQQWLFWKFTLCGKGTCMLPNVSMKRKWRNDARWPGFWMTDDELQKLVKEVMDEHFVLRSQE